MSLEAFARFAIWLLRQALESNHSGYD